MQAISDSDHRQKSLNLRFFRYTVGTLVR